MKSQVHAIKPLALATVTVVLFLSALLRAEEAASNAKPAAETKPAEKKPQPEAQAPVAETPGDNAVNNAPVEQPGQGKKGAEESPDKKTVQTLEEVVVTATRVETPVENIPADVSVVTPSRLERPGTDNFQQALSDVPGVKINSRQDNDQVTMGLEVRGLETNSTSGMNVLVLLDGIPQRRMSFGGPYVGGLPFYALDRMELVKGPLGALYGRGALAGALQLFSDPGTPTLHYDVQDTFESTVNSNTTAVHVSGPVPKISGGTFSLTAMTDFFGGWQPNTDGARGNFYLHSRLPLSNNDTVDIMAGAFSGQEGMAGPVPIDQSGHRLPGVSRDANLTVPDHNSSDVTEFRLGTIWNHAVTEDISSKLTLAYWHGISKWKDGLVDDGPTPGTTIIAQDVDLDQWHENDYYAEYQLQKTFRLTEAVTGTMTGGINADYSDANHRGLPISGVSLDYSTMTETPKNAWTYGSWNEVDANELDYGAFAKLQLAFLECINLTGGIRYDHFHRSQHDNGTGANSVLDDGVWTPSVGVAFNALKSKDSWLTPYLSWGRGFAPAYRAVGSVSIVNIKPETSVSYEAGLKGNWRHIVEGTCALYELNRYDVIGNNPNTHTKDNVGDWRIKGFEAGLKTHPIKPVSLYGSYTIRSPIIERDIANPQAAGNEIPFISRQMFTVGAEYRHSCGFNIGAEDHYCTRSFDDEANAYRLPAYNLLDVFAGYQRGRYSASVFIKNALDKEYYSAIYNGIVNGNAFEGLPRTIGVNFRVKF